MRARLLGFTLTPPGIFNGFLFDPVTDMFTTLDAAGAMDTSLLGLNNNGEAVGFAVDMAGAMHGIVCSVTALTCTQFDDPAGIGTTTFTASTTSARSSTSM